MATRKDTEIDLFLQAWAVAETGSPNNVITAALKNNGFNRIEAQIGRKKKELSRSYKLLRPDLDKLDTNFRF